jgi:uroporphyrinogen decarboxylase
MVMSGRKRFFTAVDLSTPDTVPITDLGLDPSIVEAITGEKIEGYSLVAVSDSNAWESSIKNRIFLQKACMKLGFDGIPAVSDYSLCSKSYQPKTISDTRFIDEWGRVLDTRKEIKTVWWVGGTIETREDIENYLPPDPEAGEMYEMVERVLKPLRKKNFAVLGLGHTGWHMAFQVRGGIDKLLLDMYRRPNLAKRLIDKIAKTCQDIIKLMLDGGAEAIFLTDDYADNHLPFMNKKMFNYFELPNLNNIVRIANKRGIPVLKHSDGNIYPILNDMMDTGISGIHPIEPNVMDIRDFKKRYGDKLCIVGNVDCQHVLPFGSEKDVRLDVRRCIDAAAKDGGYILASSNSLHANCKIENIFTMVDETRKYGRYRQ